MRVRILLAAQLVWSAAAFLRVPSLQVSMRPTTARQSVLCMAESYDYDVIIVG